MCVNCVTSAESIVVNVAGVLALADHLIAGWSPDGRAAAWDANAEFVARLGLDPAAVLGARPAVERRRAAGRAPAGRLAWA